MTDTSAPMGRYRRPVSPLHAEKATKLLNNYYKQIKAIICIDPCAKTVNISLIDYANNMLLELQSYVFVFSNEEVENQKCNLVEAIQGWCNVM